MVIRSYPGSIQNCYTCIIIIIIFFIIIWRNNFLLKYRFCLRYIFHNLNVCVVTFNDYVSTLALAFKDPQCTSIAMIAILFVDCPTTHSVSRLYSVGIILQGPTLQYVYTSSLSFRDIRCTTPTL
jgi:hypothetical protein